MGGGSMQNLKIQKIWVLWKYETVNSRRTKVLYSANGGEVSVTAANNTTIAYDEIIKLYFSLKSEHRRNAIWLMNDETVFILRTLKHNNGNYLWNNADNTILGKPVYYSSYMPNIASGNIPVVFGDFSYYWIIQRQPLTIKVLRELYSMNAEIGFSGKEDSKLSAIFLFPIFIT